MHECYLEAVKNVKLQYFAFIVQYVHVQEMVSEKASSRAQDSIRVSRGKFGRLFLRRAAIRNCLYLIKHNISTKAQAITEIKKMEGGKLQFSSGEIQSSVDTNPGGNCIPSHKAKPFKGRYCNYHRTTTNDS